MIAHLDRRYYFIMAGMVLLHIVIIAASNYLVQIPFELFGFNTTWGAYTYPLVFLATDLTVRLFGGAMARRIVFWAMLPALVVSYVFSVAFVDGRYIGLAALAVPSIFVLRIVIASFSAYLCGQLLDIVVFRRLRQRKAWWVAPLGANTVGSFIDTLVFFFIAFWRSPDAFMAAHWIELGLADYAFKLVVGIGVFVPAYGVILRWVKDKVLAWAYGTEQAEAVSLS